jgi:mannitol/fructose-specific phosphotransferase system IIA component (Ntr-type)
MILSSDDMINIFQKDYDYLLSFLSTNIADEETMQALHQSQAVQEISLIIKLLRTADKNESGM